MSNSRVDISGGYTAEHIKAGFEKKPPAFVVKPQNPRFTSPVWKNFDCIHQDGSDIALPHWYRCNICGDFMNCNVSAGNAKLTRHLANHGTSQSTYTLTADQLFNALSSASSLGQKYGPLHPAVFELHCSKAKDVWSPNFSAEIGQFLESHHIRGFKIKLNRKIPYESESGKSKDVKKAKVDKSEMLTRSKKSS